MAISYPIDIPTDIAIANIQWTAVNVDVESRSPFTLATKSFSYPGQMFRATIQIPSVRKDKAEPWVNFLLSLRGRTGYFNLGDPNYNGPEGAASVTPGTPVVASQTDTSIGLSGAPNNITNYLKAGDYLQIGSGSNKVLHKVITDVSTSGSGTATLEVWPDPRATYTPGTPIFLANPLGLFKLASPEVTWNIDSNSAYSIVFDCNEFITA